MSNIETWYVCEDGSVANPREVSEGKDGKLKHKDGRAVAFRDDGVTPHSRSVDADNPEAGPKKGKKPSKEDKKEKEAETPETADMQPENPKRGYKTRESKAD